MNTAEWLGCLGVVSALMVAAMISEGWIKLPDLPKNVSSALAIMPVKVYDQVMYGDGGSGGASSGGSLHPVRRVAFTNELGKHDLTFPVGHTYAEDEDTIVISYKKTTLTIQKAEVEGLKIVAEYGRSQEGE
jgi:hypothetical protein